MAIEMESSSAYSQLVNWRPTRCKNIWVDIGNRGSIWDGISSLMILVSSTLGASVYPGGFHAESVLFRKWRAQCCNCFFFCAGCLITLICIPYRQNCVTYSFTKYWIWLSCYWWECCWLSASGATHIWALFLRFHCSFPSLPIINHQKFWVGCSTYEPKQKPPFSHNSLNFKIL